MKLNLGKLFQGSLIIATGQGLSQVLSFIRNAIIARLISPEDFGIAAIFTITVSLVELTSYMGAEQLLVQAEDGDDDQLQNTSHFVTIFRGVMGGILIFLFAPFISQLFNIHGTTWAFRWLSLVPFLRGLIHLDVKRYQRHFKFLPQALTEIIPQFVITLLVFPLVKWKGDYSAVLWLVIIQSFILCVATHLLAERKYQISINKIYLKRIFKFGWPLLINGLLMFGIFQGDKIIVGNFYNISLLGIYSAAFMLTMAPSLLIANTTNSLFLSLLSRSQNQRKIFRANYIFSFDILLIVAGLMGIFFIICGGQLLGFAFGENYLGYGATVAWLGIMWSMRTLRIAPTMASIALGDTKTAMMSNWIRGLALLFTLIIALQRTELYLIAFSGSLGEFLALLITAFFLQKYHNISFKICLEKTLILIVFYCLSGTTLFLLHDTNLFKVITLWLLLSLGFLVFLSLTNHSLRKVLKNLIVK